MSPHIHSVTLQFDAALDNKLRQFWHLHAQGNLSAGIPVWHEELGPHLSLGGGPDLNRLNWDSLCLELPTWPTVTLESAGLFPGGIVAFLTPRVTLELLKFHAALYRAVGESSRDWLPQYQPGV